MFFGAMAMTLSRRGDRDGDDTGVTVINEGAREIPLKEEASMEEREEGACIASLFSFFSLSLSVSFFLLFLLCSAQAEREIGLWRLQRDGCYCNQTKERESAGGGSVATNR